MTKDKGQISEVLIIGGGVIGLSLARELHKRGFRRITILEKGAVGREASYAAAGMLAVQSETDKPDEFFEFCSESNKLYPRFAEELLDETGVDIELDKEGTLYLAFNKTDENKLRERFEWQKKAGLAVEKLSAIETHKLEPFVSPDILGSLYFPNDWQVENRKLLHALEKYAEFNGIEIRENTEIKNLLIENRQSYRRGNLSGKVFRRNGRACNGRVDFAHQRRGVFIAGNKTDSRSNHRISHGETSFRKSDLQPARLSRAASRRSDFIGCDG